MTDLQPQLNIEDNTCDTSELTYEQQLTIIAEESTQAYNDQSLRLYDLIYKIIPYLANEVYTGKLSPIALWDKEWIIEGAGKVAFNWDCFDVQNLLFSPSSCMILYIFPEPIKFPEAKFAILTIDFYNKKNYYISYYTLEKSYDNSWVLGGIDIAGQMSHINYGRVSYEPTLENFKNDVLNLVSAHCHSLNFIMMIHWFKNLFRRNKDSKK